MASGPVQKNKTTSRQKGPGKGGRKKREAGGARRGRQAGSRAGGRQAAMVGEAAASAAASVSPAQQQQQQAAGNLLPGLPDDLACLCLACIPLWQQARLKCVCRAWKEALSARFLFDLRSRLGKAEEFLCVFWDDPALTPGELWDPRARVWRCLPPMPCDPYSYGLTNFECVAVGSALLVMGGSLFDTRAFPMDRPLASSACFRLDSLTQEWHRVADMPTARGSFAAVAWSGQVYAAGGGSRHAQFGAGGSRVTAVERYDVKEDRWHQVAGLSRIRAGCVGFFLHGRFYVMGGYGDSRTIAGILPVDEFYSDGEVLDPASGTWTLLAPMWQPGERTRLGKVALLGDSVFMLDGAAIFRYPS